jgi:hypothetical protein
VDDDHPGLAEAGFRRLRDDTGAEQHRCDGDEQQRAT